MLATPGWRNEAQFGPDQLALRMKTDRPYLFGLLTVFRLRDIRPSIKVISTFVSRLPGDERDIVLSGLSL